MHECSFTGTKMPYIGVVLASERISYFDIKYLHLCKGSCVKGIVLLCVCLKVPQLLEVDITLIFSGFFASF